MGNASNQTITTNKSKREQKQHEHTSSPHNHNPGLVMPGKSGTQFNQGLVDGITTLQALATSDHPVGSRELARRLEMDTSKVNRLLRTLTYLGITRQTADRKYTAGPGMHVLAAQSLFASGLIKHALKPLESLTHYGLIVAMGVLWRDSVSFLYHALPGMPSHEALGRIGLYPATESGLGVALLANLSDDQIRDIYTTHDIPHFPEGIESLLDTVQNTRNLGYARFETKVKTHQHTIAVTVGDPVVCAIGVSGWIPESVTGEIVEELKAVSEAIKLN